MNTKELLTVTAGKLFAQNGFEGVSTRMIADEAGLKLSSIHYHFGSKDNLYVESFLYAIDARSHTIFGDVISENNALLKTPSGQAEIIRNTIYRKFYDLFRPDREEWKTQIIVREMMNPSSALQVLAEKIFKPDDDSAVLFYKTVRSKASTKEARAWADMLHSHMFFYIMAKEPLEFVRGEGALNTEFTSVASRVLARAMIMELELPLPEDLR